MRAEFVEPLAAAWTRVHARDLTPAPDPSDQGRYCQGDPARRATRRARGRAARARSGARTAARGRASSWVGEPGIGKTRLLAELEAIADGRGCLVLSGSASELERDLPFWVFVDALEDYVRGLPPAVLAPLGGELERVLPGSGIRARRARRTSATAPTRPCASCSTLLGARQPLVLMLDDLHWADSGLAGAARLAAAPAAAGAGAARARRPPAPGAGEAAAGARARAPRGHADAGSSWTRSAARTRASCTARRPRRVYEESGGNPFYLQQLARALGRTGHVPRDVTAALAEELALLGEPARAAAAGRRRRRRPFAPELAAAAAAVDEPAALDALDELLRTDLVRTTEVPRRFRFRHPLVRRAVYDAAPAGWRLGAHERAAAALARSGASAAARAQHVERYAREGDLDAVAALRDAGLAADPAAPASAAHWFAAALAAAARRRAERRAARAAAPARPRALADRRVRGQPRGADRGPADRPARLPAARADDRRVRDDGAAARAPRRGPRPRGARARRAARTAPCRTRWR